jgi:uncharacterized protein involved in exopolysaccharide biosynthesis
MPDTHGRGFATKFWVRVFIVAMLAGICAGLYTYTLHRRYESTELIVFPGAPSASSALSSIGLDKMGGSSDEGAVPILGNMLSTAIVGSNRDAALSIVTSRGCLEHVVKDQNLLEVYHLSKMSKAIMMLKQRLNSSIDKQGMLNITCDDENSARAVGIIRSVEGYLRQQSDVLALNQSRKNREFVQGQLILKKRQLERVEAIVEKDMATKPLTIVEERDKAIEAIHQAAVEAQVKADGAHAQIERSKSMLRRIISQSGSYGGKSVALSALSDSLSDLANDLLQRRTALEEAAKKYAKTSPEAKIAKEEFDAADEVANNVFAQETKNLNGGEEPSLVEAEGEYASLSRQADEYEAAVRRMTSKMAADAASYIQNQYLQAEFKATVEQYTRMQMDLDLAKIAEARDPARFEVLDEPAETDEAVYPKRPLTVGVVFFLAIIIQLIPLLFKGSRGPEGEQAF